MNRRGFLKWGSFLTVSVATTGLAGCGSDDSNTPAPTGNSTVYAYPQGVASGDPRADSIVLWTRVEGGSASSIPVTVQLATDKAFTQLLVNASVNATADWDNTIRHKVTGLNPATTYYYRFVAAGSNASPVGRTRTAPAAGTPVSQLKFAFITCQDWSVNHWAGFTDLAALDDLDFIVHLGDYIYETIGAGFQTGSVESAHGPLTLPSGGTAEPGDSSSRYATTLDDYRALYKQYRSDARLQNLHALFPFIAIWDDHEFSDDCWQDNETYGVTPNVEQLGRRRGANQAWFEFMPADVTLDTSNPSFNNIQIYRSFQFGSLATLVMTDERLNRSQHLVPHYAALGGVSGQSSVGTRYFVSQATLQTAETTLQGGASTNLTPVSILGDTQRQWWKDQMSASTATWKLWGNEVSLLRMQLDGTQAVAGLLFQNLVAAQPALASQQSAIQTALVTDLMTGATQTAQQTINVTFTNTIAALTGILNAAGDPNAAADAAGIAAQFNVALAAIPYLMLDKFILDADQWDGYDAERKDLLSHLKTRGISNVVALTGDIHAFFAGQVMDDYDAGSPAPVMVDLVTAGISSNSWFSFFKDAVDSTPAFAAAKALVYTESGGTITNTFTNTVKSFNPWLNYVDTDAQGYAVVTLTPTRLTCVFNKVKPLNGTTAPASPATASQTTVTVPAVPAGTPPTLTVS